MTDVILIYAQRLETSEIRRLKDIIGAYYIEKIDVNRETVSELCLSLFNVPTLYTMQAYLCEDIIGLSFLTAGAELKPLLIFPNDQETLLQLDEFAEMIRVSKEIRSKADSIHTLVASLHTTAMKLNAKIDGSFANEWIDNIEPACLVQTIDAIEAARKFYGEMLYNLG